MLNLILGLILSAAAVFLIVYICLKIYMLGAAHANISNAINKGLRDEEIAKILINTKNQIENQKDNKSDHNKQGKNPLF